MIKLEIEKVYHRSRAPLVKYKDYIAYALGASGECWPNARTTKGNHKTFWFIVYAERKYKDIRSFFDTKKKDFTLI